MINVLRCRSTWGPHADPQRVVLGRKNFLFAGSDAGGEVLADAMTVIETAKLSGLNPEDYLADILGRIRAHDPRRLDELLPWAWKTDKDACRKAP